MSRVARSARVASRQRVETISADKAIGAAETGELYLIAHANDATALTITLPPMQDGAYFKFIWKSDMTHDSATVVFNSNTNTEGDFAGAIIEATDDGADGAVATERAGSEDVLTIGSSNDTFTGSYLECYCDGLKWYWTGVIVAAAAGNAVFST